MASKQNICEFSATRLLYLPVKISSRALVLKVVSNIGVFCLIDISAVVVVVVVILALVELLFSVVVGLVSKKQFIEFKE